MVVPAAPESADRHGRHLYTVLVDVDEKCASRDDILQLLTAQNIGAGVHYLSIPEHSYYQAKFGWRPEDYPVATEVGRRTISLPLSPGLSDDDVSDVVEAVRSALERG